MNWRCDTLLRYIDLATATCGGPNDYARRMRNSVDLLLRAIHDCTNCFGRRVQPS